MGPKLNPLNNTRLSPEWATQFAQDKNGVGPKPICWLGFREWYGQLSEMRSLLTNARLLLLTATASTSSRRSIIDKMICTSNVEEIIQCPDRENVKLHVLKYKSNLHEKQVFDSVIQNVLKYKDNCRRIVIFCRTVTRVYVRWSISAWAFICIGLSLNTNSTYRDK
jgi:hypothetical protein